MELSPRSAIFVVFKVQVFKIGGRDSATRFVGWRFFMPVYDRKYLLYPGGAYPRAMVVMTFASLF